MKKVIKITGILVCMVVLFLNISLNHKSSTGNIDLSKLMVANEADAECYPYTGVVPGYCFAESCYFSGPEINCDPYGFR